jgi:FkbM family methyltransferase
MSLTDNVPKRAKDLSPHEIRALVGTDSPLILEIGCNDGTDTIRFLDAMPKARIICFEPDPRPASRFKCAGDSRVTLHQVAISDRLGYANLYQSGGMPPRLRAMPNSGSLDDWDMSSSILRPTGHLAKSPWCTFTKSTKVQTVPLDHYESLYGTVDFIWADVQGAEALLILGGQKTLRRTRYLYTEYYDDPMYDRQPDLKALLSFLPRWNLLGIYGSNALLKNTEPEH